MSLPADLSGNGKAGPGWTIPVRPGYRTVNGQERKSRLEQAGIFMTKSELIEQIAAKHSQLSAKDIELAVKAIISYMADVLAEGGRIEIRGFGSFSLHYRAPRTGRNPKTGEPVVLSGKYVPHFKPGKELRDRVNGSLEDELPADLS
jgi:integration host factor subunit beta